jgi:hypothetical protein
VWDCFSKRAARILSGVLLAGAPLLAPCIHAAESLPEVDISDYLPSSTTGPILKSVGLLTAHRPYQGASSLLGEGATGMGLDLGIEATLMGIPSDLTIPGTDTSIPLASLPIAKLHLSKALGPSLDFSFSGILYKSTYIAGGAAKILLYRPTEGFEWALRGGLSFTSFNLSEVTGQTLPIEDGGFTIGEMQPVFRTQNFTLHVVASHVMDFAEPYIALGANSTRAQLASIVTLNAVEADQTLTTEAVSQTTGEAILGVRFRIPAIGLRLGIEGSYNSAKMHTLGLMIGVGL